MSGLGTRRDHNPSEQGILRGQGREIDEGFPVGNEDLTRKLVESHLAEVPPTHHHRSTGGTC